MFDKKQKMSFDIYLVFSVTSVEPSTMMKRTPSCATAVDSVNMQSLSTQSLAGIVIKPEFLP